MMKKLSFKEAAIKILREAEEPLSPKEITRIALNDGLIETSGATPDATMAAQLYTDSGKFKKVGKGVFALLKQKESTKSPLLAIENQNSLVRDSLLDKVRKMDPFQFEYLIAELLEKIGYENVHVTKRSGDNGIDVLGNLTVGGLTNVKTVIQAKRYKKGNNIAGKVITQLRGSAEVDQRGLVITTSDFTKAAIEESRANNKMPVALVNSSKLIDLLLKHEVGVKQEIVKVYSVDLELFENDLIESESLSKVHKSKAIWPLPGGTENYIDTLDALLDQIGAKTRTKSDLINWFISEYENVSSERTAKGYLNVPRNMGLIRFRGDKVSITDAGKRYKKDKDFEFLFETISQNILAFEEIFEFLSNSPSAQTKENILQYVTENFEVDWSTMAQVNWRLRWLINLNKISKTENGTFENN